MEGFSHLASNRRFHRLLFYAIIVVFAALTINDVQKLVMQYWNGEKKSNLNINFNETVTL